MAAKSGDQNAASAVQSRLLDDRYELGELTSSSGMLDVHSGYDTLLERPVEIKLLRPELARERGFRLRFRKEAQAASRLSHPGIVRVYDTGEMTDPRGEPVPYIVTEVPQGTPLNELISYGSITPTHAVSYASGILDALEYAHRAGTLHRDLSPSNVLVDDEGNVKVNNFGIARAVTDSNPTVADATAVLGSADYFSPEQAKGDPIDVRSDLYGVGAVLYEMLTGRPPFEGSTPVAVAYQHMSEAPKPPSKVNSTAPASLDRISLESLAKDPDRRPADATQFREKLRRAAAGRAPSQHQLEALTADLYGPAQRNAAETARSLRQLSTDTTMTRTQAGPPVAWVWGGVMVLAALLASILFWTSGIEPGKEAAIQSVEIPPVAGETYEDAKALIEETSLVVERLDEPSATVPEGHVTRTRPLSGTTVRENSEIDVWVSSGPKNAVVPEIAGLTEAEARTKITEAGLLMGRVMPEIDTTQAPHTALGISVGGESYESGDELPDGTRVDLRVAAWRTALPDMSGWTTDTAEERAKELGLVPTVADDPGCPTANPRGVASMSHSVGDLDVGTEVTLYVCSG